MHMLLGVPVGQTIIHLCLIVFVQYGGVADFDPLVFFQRGGVATGDLL